MKNLQFVHGVNVSESEINANVEWALARSDQWNDINDRSALIVGGAPSLKRTTKEISERVIKKGHRVPYDSIYALNNAWRHLWANGVECGNVVLMDARKENEHFVTSPPDSNYGVRWWIASQCHPEVFEELWRKRQHINLWHVAGSTAVSDRNLHGVIGGGTVLSRAISIAFNKGARNIVLAGVDSSHDQECHHAYEQALNDDDDIIEVFTPRGTGPFKTTPEFGAQADCVMNQMLQLEKKGARFEIIGDGLLPTLWAEHCEDRSKPETWEPKKYKQMWARDEYRRYSPAEILFPQIIAALDCATIKKKKLIDFGTGTGRMALMAQQCGFDVLAIDFADNCMDEDPANHVKLKVCNLWEPIKSKAKADCGTCIDVMEHIPTDKVDAVLANIAANCVKCVFHIAYEPDAMGSLIGEPLHLTVRPAQWWHEKLGKHFKTVKSANNLWICEANQ